MTDTQLQAMLSFLETSTKKAYEEDEVPKDKKIIEDLKYLDDQEPMHTLDVIYPDYKQDTYPFIIYIHGGGFCMHHKNEIYRHHALRLANDVFAVVNINYRLAPKASYQDMIDDLHAVLSYLQQCGRQLHLDLKRMFVAGDSSGAYLASYLPFLVQSYTPLDMKSIACCCGLFDFDTFLQDSTCKFPIKKEMLHLLFQDDIPKASSILSRITPSYPPVYLMDSAYQSFSGEAKRMKAVLDKHAVSNALYIIPKEEKLPHNFQLLWKYPQSAMVLETIFDFFHQYL
ncbi:MULTISPECIES: alpha/beta hydrolase [unclassified Amedibacterium]|uniref:alpha/beta hydrolase n=1 Tax=unclassified Amedibacterium TaxID=3088137 RepID=UPI000E3F6E13|nr:MULTISPECIES: alpha/beta hydrolase [unclassified Absiella]RGB68110.1 alpha/beta hydrolase [Absiella sp. AM09-45]RGB79327.1 alpha/beta hydrolase [Absiella sp. AM09-50]RGC46876.1 alpha/beta hydrolase [Absiella sp. AM29-15]